MDYKEKIASLNKKKYPVDVPDWEMKVYMRKLSVREFKEVFKVDDKELGEILEMLEGTDEEKQKAKELLKIQDDQISENVIACCYDENDERMFQDSDLKDIANNYCTLSTSKILTKHFLCLNNMNLDQNNDAKKN